MPKDFIIFTEEELDKMKAGGMVTLITDNSDMVTIYTSEEGYKKFLDFWETEDDNS